VSNPSNADRSAGFDLPGVCSPRAPLANLKPYSGSFPAGKTIMAANESPYNLSEGLRDKIARAVRGFDFNRYPDPLATDLRAQIADNYQLKPEQVLLGNGGDELLLDMMIAWGGKGRSILQFMPTFTMYGIYAQTFETAVISLLRDPQTYAIDIDLALETLRAQQPSICLLCNPNNPSGQVTPVADICRLIEASDALFVVDEAYAEFSGTSMLPYLDRYPNLVILRTFSKAYSLAGLRLGYLMASPAIIEMIARVRMPYSVNSFSQMVGSLLLDNKEEFDQACADIMRERDWLYDVLQDMAGVKVWPSSANYLLFQVEKAAEVWERLLYVHDICIRHFKDAPGLDNCLRVTVGTSQENIAFTAALRESIAYVNLPDDFFCGS